MAAMTLIAMIIAYLIGSINSSIILSKLLKTVDPRTKGSGNAGATNILRLIGKKEALAVMVFDAVKGFIAIFIGHLLGATGFLLGLVGVCAVVGHIFPVFFKFKGGKGVATSLGAVLCMAFFPGVLAIAIWVGTVYFIGYASLASLIAIGAAAILVLVFHYYAFFIPVLIMAGLITWRHLPNIKRLKEGTEDKFTF